MAKTTSLKPLTVKENLALPMVFEKRSPEEIEARVEEVSKMLSISHLLNKHSYEISGGEAQRTAIGRAIFNHPSLLLADEPTEGIMLFTLLVQFIYFMILRRSYLKHILSARS